MVIRALHVSTTRRHYKGKVYETHLLRRFVPRGREGRDRDGGNLSHLPPELIELIELVRRGLRGLRGERFLAAGDLERGASLPHGAVVAVLGTLRRLGLESVLDPRPSRRRNLATGVIVARLLAPGSKLDTARRLARTTLGAVLGVGDATSDELYAAMDWLLVRQPRIEARLAARHTGPRRSGPV